MTILSTLTQLELMTNKTEPAESFRYHIFYFNKEKVSFNWYFTEYNSDMAATVQLLNSFGVVPMCIEEPVSSNYWMNN